MTLGETVVATAVFVGVGYAVVRWYLINEDGLNVELFDSEG
jgi:hypothetical protein